MNHNNSNKRRNSLIFALVMAALLTGCVRSQPIQYYQLSALREDRVIAEFAIPKDVSIGLGPVSLPAYLDRPQIVSRTSANRLTLAGKDRWVEPLAENIAQVLSEDLSMLLDTDRILLYPWTLDNTVDCQIKVDVLQFEGGSDGTVNITARWQVIGKNGLLSLPEKRSSFNINATSQDQEAMIAALSQGVFRLAREIATALPPLLRR